MVLVMHFRTYLEMEMKKIKGIQLSKIDLNNNTSLTNNIELRIWFILLLTLL